MRCHKRGGPMYYEKFYGHGQVGWMPRLPAAGAGRKADPVIISTFPGSPALWAGSFTLTAFSGGGVLSVGRLLIRSSLRIGTRRDNNVPRLQICDLWFLQIHRSGRGSVHTGFSPLFVFTLVPCRACMPAVGRGGGFTPAISICPKLWHKIKINGSVSDFTHVENGDDPKSFFFVYGSAP